MINEAGPLQQSLWYSPTRAFEIVVTPARPTKPPTLKPPTKPPTLKRPRKQTKKEIERERKRNVGVGKDEKEPQKPAPGVDFLHDYDVNRSFGPDADKKIFNSILALYTDECINAFKAAGLKDQFTLVTAAGGGIVVGPASLTTNPSNLGYMGIPEQARKDILAHFSSSEAKGFTVFGEFTSDGRPRIFLNTSAFTYGLEGLVDYMAHEFIHGAGVKG